MAQQKLYTKEMFLIAAEKCEVSMIDANHIMKYIDEYVTPIELASDEEIDAHVEDDFLNSTEVHKYSEEVQLLMKAMCKAGMKYMRDKIQGGNK